MNQLGLLFTVTKKGALQPGVWLAIALLVATPPVLIWAPMSLAIAYFVLLSITVLTTLGVFVRHSLTDPEVLRSEDFHIKNKALDVLERNYEVAPHLKGIFEDTPVTPMKYLEHRKESSDE